MDEIKVLFVNQEIEPYVVGTQMASLGLKFPQQAQEMGHEVRTFMPKFGVINERRNQLHEVIRLSGLNLNIANIDHPLIIKVASLQSLRLQVYFIDNEDYFLRRGIFHDEFGLPYNDNDQRALFFAKGVLETVKKLRWVPDIIHCNGWFSSFLPPLVRTAYSHEPIFSRVKILYTLYEDAGNEPTGENTEELLKSLKMGLDDESLRCNGTHDALCRLAITHSHAVGQGESEVDETLLEYAEKQGKPIYDLRIPDALKETYQELYAKVAAE